jgi:hypothetical protein
MEKLAETIRRNKKDVFEYRLVKRNDDVAMFAQWYLDCDEPRIVAYEVFFIRKQKPKTRTIPGHGEVEYHAKELFPRDEDFGYSAWSITDVKRADEKFEELTRRAYYAYKAIRN